MGRGEVVDSARWADRKHPHSLAGSGRKQRRDDGQEDKDKGGRPARERGGERKIETTTTNSTALLVLTTMTSSLSDLSRKLWVTRKEGKERGLIS
jgi:hypothetical protein